MSQSQTTIALSRRYAVSITILTPHIGFNQEAQANIGVEVAEKLAHYSDNGTTVSDEFPWGTPQHQGKHRLRNAR